VLTLKLTILIFSSARKQIEDIVPIIRSDRDIHSLVIIKYYSQSSPPSLYGMFTSSGNLHILRAVEPGLRLHYRERNCQDSNRQCMDIRAFNLGSKSQLAQLILDYLAGHITT
jgi:hypothetical protein